MESGRSEQIVSQMYVVYVCVCRRVGNDMDGRKGEEGGGWGMEGMLHLCFLTQFTTTLKSCDC